MRICILHGTVFGSLCVNVISMTNKHVNEVRNVAVATKK